MKCVAYLLVVAACILAIDPIATAQSLPKIEGTTLDDQKIVLPDPAHYRALVLVIGFSHKSADQSEAWMKSIAADLAAQPRIGYFEIPEMQGVPGMVKPMILHGMRREIPPAAHPHFVPIYQHEDELKKLVNYKEPAETYVVVTDKDGRILWQTHGAISQEKYSKLRQTLDENSSK